MQHIKMARMCRACLTLDSLLQPMDDNFIQGYNILTNISVKTSDSLPQLACTSCLENVTNFILFREKCIESENTLKFILSETVDTKDGIIKVIHIDESHVKQEVLLKEEENDEILPCSDFDDHSDSQAFEYQETKEVLIKKSKVKKSRAKKCNIKLTSKKENMIPVVKNMPEDKTFLQCGICSKEFEDGLQLNDHLENHKKYKQCELCFEKFHQWPSLLAHRISHINRYKEKKCHYCNKSVKCVYKLELHYRLLHYDGENKLVSCKYCAKSFSSARKLKRHIKASHEKIRMFQCDHCEKFISTKSGLITHLRKHSEEKPFKCGSCDFACKYRSGIRLHTIRKHSTVKVVYCKKCGRDFYTAEALEKHECKSRATMCPICGVIKSKRLKMHMATHHFGEIFKCELCPAEFKSKSGWKVHTQKHSGNRRFACEFCSRKFFTSAVLMKHRRVHTGEKPFVCKICQKGFTGNHNLRVHMKVHGEDLVVKRVKNKSEEDTPSGSFYSTK